MPPWLKTFTSPVGQVARWNEHLAEYDFQIEHRPGARHANADALSRIDFDQPAGAILSTADEVLSDAHVRAVTVDLDDSDSDLWQKAVADDPDISLVVKRLRDARSTENDEPCAVILQGDSNTVRTLLTQQSKLTISNNILYRTIDATLDRESYKQLVVPTSLRDRVLALAHGHPSSGHFGVDRTLARLRLTCYWPNMSTSVALYCRNCNVCAVCKNPRPLPRAGMSHVKAGEPFETIALDIMGPLPSTSNNNKYILVIGDYFTKWLEIIPLPNITAQTVAVALVERIFVRFGAPEKIHSDQGSQFCSQLFLELCKRFDVKKTRTTPYHPMCDGMIERANRTIQVMLRAFIDSADCDSWDERLPLAQLAYNTSVHNSTHYTPFFLLFGREARLPLDLLCPTPDPTPVTFSPTSYVIRLRERLEAAYRLVREHLDVGHRRAKTNYDLKANADTLKVGQFVWLYRHPQAGDSPKLFRYWDGPWQVSVVHSPLVYTIKRLGVHSARRTTVMTVHRNRLKRIFGPVNLPPVDAPVNPPPAPIMAGVTIPRLPSSFTPLF